MKNQNLPKKNINFFKQKYINIKNASQNNLKNISLKIPLNQISVVTGVSGSGKSSLVFDTINAEGQRRYIETFSSYARQFLDRLDKPMVDSIEGILPSVAINQLNPVKTSRSTVGTMTEISDYFKLLFSRGADLYCNICEKEIKVDEFTSIINFINVELKDKKIAIIFNLEIGNLSQNEINDWLSSQGYTKIFSTSKKQIKVISDRFIVNSKISNDRILEALKNANKTGKGWFEIVNLETKTVIRKCSTKFTCSECKIDHSEPRPAIFSFNSAIGACSNCKGFGKVIGIDENLIIPNKNRTISDGVVKPFQSNAYIEFQNELLKFSVNRNVPIDIPWKNLSQTQKKWIFEGEENFNGSWKKSWGGINRFFSKLESKSYKMHIRVFLSRYRSYSECQLCKGSRLKPEALQWKILEKNIHQWFTLTIDEICTLLKKFEKKILSPSFSKAKKTALNIILKEINSRLLYCQEVGLGYLTLDRQSRTLSGGEVQRINLTTALGSSLTNTLFILDEPSIGLHSRDIKNLIKVIKRLKNSGNTILIVEHDSEVISTADNIIEIGPGPGIKGGKICFEGIYTDLLKSSCITGIYLNKKKISKKEINKDRATNLNFFEITGINSNNLKDFSVSIPKNSLCCITGVSGSGKSTLTEIIYSSVSKYIGKNKTIIGRYKKLLGCENFSDVILVDQNSLNKTSRSNPIVYVGGFNNIRNLFAKLETSIQSGFKASHFSFNAGEGRCSECMGSGFEKIEMQFLSDIFLKCESCNGKRYKSKILNIKYKGLSISEVLDLNVSEALKFFDDQFLKNKLEKLELVGLGYLSLGQPLTTLSGGELQRLKIAGHLVEKNNSSRFKNNNNDKNLFIFDEPTTGLHLSDIAVLTKAMRSLIFEGHSLVIVEHCLEFIEQSDYIIELGPDAGENGGKLIASGTPNEIMETRSNTGIALKKHFKSKKNKLFFDKDKKIETCVKKSIEIKNARENNLKDVSTDIPLGKLTVITGVSGSGKSSLAFDVLFSEGQRRYLESLNAYARQFVQPASKPDIDSITGIPPTVSIEQRISRGGFKSTVGTLTEIHHFLRLLFVKIGKQSCPNCLIKIEAQSKEEITQSIKKNYKNKIIKIFSPLVMKRKGKYKELFQWISSRKYKYVKVDNILYLVNEYPNLDRYKEHSIELLITEIEVKKINFQTLEEKIVEALNYGKGNLQIEEKIHKSNDVNFTPLSIKNFSLNRTCPGCGEGFNDLDPRNFSFNSKIGWCPSCQGSGISFKKNQVELINLTKNYEDEDFVELSKKNSLTENKCSDCNGDRLNILARSVFLGKESIATLSKKPISNLIIWLENFYTSMDQRNSLISKDIFKELVARLYFLKKVGLEYLALDRAAPTLSGGEAQRIRLASQLGSNLTGVCYILDEPTIGLHPKDNFLLLKILKELKTKGNTVVVVEHDEEAIRSADHIIDIGPSAGKNGGEIIAQGKIEEIKKSKKSITGIFLRKPIKALNLNRKSKIKNYIKIEGANLNNLKTISVKFPLKHLTVVTGVSGSGKSTLIREVLLKNIQNLKNKTNLHHDFYGCKEIINWNLIDKILEVDQTPIGKTPRSTPATYVGFWDAIRKVFAENNEAKAKGWGASHFSFNSGEGKCSSCKGYGFEKIEMSFLPNVKVKCASCNGMRFNFETRKILWKGKSISDVLEMNFADACDFFDNHPIIKKPLKLLNDLGLGYLTLGQASSTLSGGESQRIKLISELKKNTDSMNSLYILDEPTVGLHMADVQKLLMVVRKLVDAGNTVVIIEHNLDIWSAADWIIDLGPKGGEEGGHLLCQNTPANLKELKTSTAKILKKHLQS